MNVNNGLKCKAKNVMQPNLTFVKIYQTFYSFFNQQKVCEICKRKFPSKTFTS